MSLGSNIRALREQHKLSQADLAKILGVTDKAVSTWENDIKVPRMGSIQKMADYFGIQKSNIIEENGILESQSDLAVDSFSLPRNMFKPQFKKVPLLGTIACGTPILAEENIETLVECEANLKADFALECKGNSMINARINDGDIVFIRKQPAVNNGEIAAVCIDDGCDSEATLKRVHIENTHIMLIPENPAHTPLTFVGEDMNKVRIIGKAVGFLSYI